MELKDKIKDALTKAKVIEIMSCLGSDAREYSTDTRFIPVCHGGDKHTLIYYEDNHLFHCTTCCGYIDIFDVVRGATGCSWQEACEYLCDKLGISSNMRIGIQHIKEYDEEESIKRKEEYLDVTANRHDVPVKDTKALKYFEKKYYTGWIDEGISVKSMRKFGILWHEYRKWIIIPCRNIKGKLIGVRRRTLDPDDENKYMPVYIRSKGFPDYSFATGLALYGLYENKDIIQRTGKCVVFEGEKSVLKADTLYGEYPCVATYGHNISREQILKLYDLGVKEIVLAYDYDNNGEFTRYIEKKHKIEEFGITCYVMYEGYNELLNEHDAPIDKGDKVFRQLLANKNKYENL